MAKTASQIAARITKLEEQVAKLRIEQANAPTEFVPEVGDEVVFKFGRAEKVRERTGKVIAIQNNEKGSPTVVILAGEGADVEVCRVLALHVVGKVGEEAGEEVAGEEAAADGVDA